MSTEKTLQIKEIKNQNLFDFLSEPDRQTFLNGFTRKEYTKGHTLIKQGETQAHVYLVESGSLNKIRGQHEEGSKAIIKRGEAAGLLHFFQNVKAHCTLQVVEDSVIWELDSETFKKLLKENASLNNGYIHFLNTKLISKIHNYHNLHTQLSAKGLKVAFFANQSYWQTTFKSVIKEKQYPLDISWFEERLTKNTIPLALGAKVVCCFVSDIIDADVVNGLSKAGVELIAMRCAGIDNVDLESVKQNKLSLTRVPAYSPYAVAEFAVTLMLSLNRKIVKASRRVKELNFSLSGLVGFDIYGKTVGVLGTGKIGKIVCDILTGFGCSILAYDVFENPDLKNRPNIKYVSKEELLKQSDIISLHAPLLKETHHIINAEAIKLMKDGVMLINTSRGGLIDTPALLEAVLSGKIGAAGLDVIEGEKGIFYEDWSESAGLRNETLARLIACNNVLVTSHQAFLTKEALRNIATSTLESIDSFRQGKRGKELQNVVQEAL